MQHKNQSLNHVDLIEYNPTVKNFKRQAKVLHRNLKQEYQANKRTDFIPLRKCQDLVAQQHGYKHWHEFHTNIKSLYEQKEENDIIKYSPQIPIFSSGKNPINVGYNKRLGLNTWLDQSQLLNHTLINGPKIFRENIENRFLKQMINQGSHIIYMNGNGEHQTTEKIVQYAKEVGREKDVRVLSFMTPYKSNVVTEEMKWYFSKNLPFSSGGLSELLMSMPDDMDDIGIDGNMWQGRAISLISALLMALVYMRDNDEIILDFNLIREYLSLDNIIKLYKTRRDFPTHIRAALRTYLISLPNFQEHAPTQSEKTQEVHGYLQMQFSLILGMLSDSYGHLFNGGKNVFDARNQLNQLLGIKQNYIFIITFPSFEHSTDELGKLATFFLGMFKNIMAQNIGKNIEEEPNKKTLMKQIEAKKNDKFIFVNSCLLSNSFTILPAQLRQLHMSLILSYDMKNNYRKMTRNENVFNSIVGNIGIKIDSDEKQNTSDKKYTYTLKLKGMEENLSV